MTNGEVTSLRKSTTATPNTEGKGYTGSPHTINFSHNTNYLHPTASTVTPKDSRLINQEPSNLSYTLKGLVSPNKIEPRSDMMPEERPIRDSSRPGAGQHIESIVSQVV